MTAGVLYADVTEKQLQQQVIDLARICGWQRRYHTYRSTRSEPGFPDLVLVRERIVFLELKTETGKLSPAQRDWLRDLAAADGETYLVRPSGLLDLLHVLAARPQDGRLSTRNGCEAQDRLRDQLWKEVACGVAED